MKVYLVQEFGEDSDHDSGEDARLFFFNNDAAKYAKSLIISQIEKVAQLNDDLYDHSLNLSDIACFLDLSDDEDDDEIKKQWEAWKNEKHSLLQIQSVIQDRFYDSGLFNYGLYIGEKEIDFGSSEIKDVIDDTINTCKNNLAFS